MLKDIIEERLKKLSRLRESGTNPYPATTRRTVSIAHARKNFKALSRSKKPLWLAGRVASLRDQGNLMFLNIKDEGGDIQVIAKKENLVDFTKWKDLLDRGDFISVRGPLIESKRGEESIDVKEIAILAKSTRPLPTEWYGIEETELRLRERHLDLLLNPETRELFRRKSRFWETFRNHLKQEGFLEVETPALEHIPGGADAEPFVTHHNALDIDLYLRISLELPLKKLLVGGFEKVFEIGRIFRNEGIDREHLQDYTQLEFYWAYHDYNDLMTLVEKMYKAVVKATTGSLMTTWQGQKINWGKKWTRIRYVEVFKKIAKIDPLLASRDELRKKAESLGLTPEAGLGKGRLIDLIFKKTVRPTLIQPAFLIDPPIEVVPLAKRSEKDSRIGERSQPVGCGTELGTGWSELNDPLDQRTRFEEQMRLRAAGDKEAQQLDEDYLQAMEYGMPPAAGFGVSERFFAVLMDKPVRETVVFPLMRPKQ
ncbi:lysine--tRNA ligase [Candidatus Parcubacteria bacterium]|nr:MAG: lysine--tRNA ligase [Candidatus Parcubacteria bacterium]